ncbi:hypothetical protein K440DRAFT_631592 [Wilcoxina mikolae CBS 423.85]|nr:hypothetical protein K440DRAFT_631592 [Wilcoxina mikolae CBS 423.85]
MAFRLFAPPAAILGVGVGAGYAYYHSTRKIPTISPPLQTEKRETSSSAFSGSSIPSLDLKQKQMAPPPRDRSGYNPTVYRQVSTGSFVGLAVGLCVSRFGKSLCLVLGALMLLVEILARQGIDVLPAGNIKRWAEQVDVRGMILKNTPFKISFGASFIMASMYG